MPLRQDIEQARDRAIIALKDAHDYVPFTSEAWRTLQTDIEREGRKIDWQNLHTMTSISGPAVLARAHGYVQVELTNSTLQQFVSIFENFLSDAIRAWILAHPKRISKRQLTGEELIALPDKPAIIEALVDKELKDVFYDRPANWFEYVKAMVNIDTPTDAEANEFAEIKATRDVLVHGQGIANAYYAAKAGRLARAQPGQPIDVPGPYHQKSWELISKLVREIGTAMAAKA
jgi:hypothetical protein